MHHRGFELPERSGFGGLWAAIDDDPPARPLAEPAHRHRVGVTAGARSPEVRRTIAAFLAATTPAATAPPNLGRTGRVVERQTRRL